MAISIVSSPTGTESLPRSSPLGGQGFGRKHPHRWALAPEDSLPGFSCGSSAECRQGKESTSKTHPAFTVAQVSLPVILILAGAHSGTSFYNSLC